MTWPSLGMPETELTFTTRSLCARRCARHNDAMNCYARGDSAKLLSVLAQSPWSACGGPRIWTWASDDKAHELSLPMILHENKGLVFLPSHFFAPLCSLIQGGEEKQSRNMAVFSPLLLLHLRHSCRSLGFIPWNYSSKADYTSEIYKVLHRAGSRNLRAAHCAAENLRKASLK